MTKGSKDTQTVKNVGKQIRSLRGQFPAKEFAKILGIHYDYLTGIERGQSSPSLSLLQRIGRYFGKCLKITFVDEIPTNCECFIVVYAGKIFGCGLDSEYAWQEAEDTLNIRRTELRDLGYVLKPAIAERR